MSADNRSTHTDALATLGTIIDSNEKRDAIHLGVEPIQAGEILYAGDNVYIKEGKAYTNKTIKEAREDNLKYVGIVDPFLTSDVLKGDWFWLIVYPRQITSLRHVWEHPDFKDSQETGGKELMAYKSQGKTWEDTPKPSEEQVHQAKLLIGDPVAKAMERVMEWANDYDVTYDDVMQHANIHVNSGDYWVHDEDGGKFEGEHLYTGFWEDYKIITKDDKVEPSKLGNFLSCSC